MEKYPKVKFVIISIIVITAVNLLVLAAVLRFSFHGRDKHQEVVKKEDTHRGFQYLKEQLELTPEQEFLFKTGREEFFASANVIFDDLEKKRIEMIHELGKNNPDTVVLYKISDDMGKLHGELKRKVVDHMLRLRTFCTPKQISKLDSMYKILIRTESPWRKIHKGDSLNREKREQVEKK